jgi:hypothetical protein
MHYETDGTTGHYNMNAPVIPLPPPCPGYLPSPFPRAQNRLTEDGPEIQSETPGIKLHCLPAIRTVKTLFKRCVHNYNTSWVRSENYKP